MHNVKGLTLIELMVTVAIVAILAAIAIPMYSGYIETARHTEGFNNLQSLRLAQEEYFLENQTYFAGADTAALITASGGLWAPAEVDAARNFVYSAAAGSTGSIATSYALTATGRGAGYQVPASVVLTLGN